MGLNRLHLRPGIFFMTSLNHCFFISSVPLQRYLSLLVLLTHALSSSFLPLSADSVDAAVVFCHVLKGSLPESCFSIIQCSFYLWKFITCPFANTEDLQIYIALCKSIHMNCSEETPCLRLFTMKKLPFLWKVYSTAKLGSILCMHSHNSWWK